MDDYEYIYVPTNFTEDRWVQAAEVRPGNPKVVHHVIVFVEHPRSGTAGSQTAERERGLAPAEAQHGHHVDERPLAGQTGRSLARSVAESGRVTFSKEIGNASNR
jgi:hypothetical protein